MYYGTAMGIQTWLLNALNREVLLPSHRRSEDDLNQRRYHSFDASSQWVLTNCHPINFCFRTLLIAKPIRCPFAKSYQHQHDRNFN